MAALKQTVGLQRLSMTGSVRNETLAFVSGPTTPKLWNKTLGQLIDEQAVQYEDKTAALFPWQSVQLSYRDLSDRSRLVARAMLSCSLHQGDRIGIMAGNCFQYIEAFLAAGRIGCPYVVMNNTYSPQELANALSISSCRLLFLADHIGPKSLANHLQRVEKEISNGSLPHLKHVVKLSDSAKDEELEQCASSKVWAYSRFVAAASGRDKTALHEAQGRVRASDTLNLQFTSGTTGDPKAAMLTHNNLINNGRFVGIKMHLTPTDIVACPPPLFHCFGLVMGFLSTITHGSTIVFPCDQFDAGLVLDALYHHKCTAVLGVPTMFISMLEANEKKKYSISTVRTGLAAGSSVPAELMRRLEQKLGIRGMLIAYGMTETSPVTFLTSLDDTEDRRTKTVGQVMPHTAAKVIKPDGETAPRGTPGELCTSGYALQQGYWNNEVKTREAMRTHEDGVLWMHTGDECVIDNSGYCSVTGRIKDIIIRGLSLLPRPRRTLPHLSQKTLIPTSLAWAVTIRVGVLITWAD